MTITDYKSSDVRDPAKARQRARESLQLQIYAMGYEAMTGRLPDALSLHFLESGLVGEVPVDPARLAKARARIARRPPGCGRATTRRDRTTSPVPTVPSAICALPASPADRSSTRLDAGVGPAHRSRPSRTCRERNPGTDIGDGHSRALDPSMGHVRRA